MSATDRKIADAANGPGMLWPWSPRRALTTSAGTLVLLLIGLGVLRSTTGLPQEQHLGWALLAITVMALLPVILMLVDATIRNRGELRVLGVSVSFAAASQEAAAGLRTATLEENLGTDVADPVGRTSLPVVLRVLRRAQETDVTVVDLKSGHTWWESRLFILVAGASIHGRPTGLAFVGEQNGTRRMFLGWADPARLLELHLAAEPTIAAAYQEALVRSRQWDLADPTPGNPTLRTMPWQNGDIRPQVTLPTGPDEGADPQYAFELFLNQTLEIKAQNLYSKPVTIQRLLELYQPALVTDTVETGSRDEQWFKILRRAHRPFFALTTNGVLKTLVPREALMTALVVGMAEKASTGTDRRDTQGKR